MNEGTTSLTGDVGHGLESGCNCLCLLKQCAHGLHRRLAMAGILVRRHTTRSHAAVLILFYAHDNRWLIPFTMHPETMLAHAGQVSFPGGMVEPGETALRPHRRELEEELGVPGPGDRNPRLPVPLECLFVSNYLVTPWVAVARGPITVRPCERRSRGSARDAASRLLDRVTMVCIRTAAAN